MRIVISIVVLLWLAANLSAATPRCIDTALKIESIAAAPDIVQPVSAIVDQQGRLLVVENHTHFRPDDYEGPETDRIRIVEDTTGDGLADRFSTFFEGEKDSMDLALHPDGSVYLATRRKIVRLVSNSAGVVAKSETIVELETEGDYPHNGLSGLAFDFKGNLFFGFGENLGKRYVVKGSDGKKVEGEADGGSVFWCTADGKSLRRVAGGFWNPFGQCVDSFGNLFAVDNDPDSSPPCRLIHVVDGGDYGYQSSSVVRASIRYKRGMEHYQGHCQWLLEQVKHHARLFATSIADFQKSIAVICWWRRGAIIVSNGFV